MCAASGVDLTLQLDVPCTAGQRAATYLTPGVNLSPADEQYV